MAVPSDHRHAIAEVFAGVGSVAQGFSRVAPFDARYLCDTDPVCRDTFIGNGGDEHAYEVTDVRQLDVARVRDRLDGVPLAGFLGCPPCQGWSAAGQRRSGDPRNLLIEDFFRLVAALTPRFVVMENVPIVAARHELAAALDHHGPTYAWWSGVLNAAAYGLPQSRQRTVVIGYHRDLGLRPSPPPPSHLGSAPVWDYKAGQPVTPTRERIDEVLGGSPTLGQGSGRHGMARLYGPDVAGLADLVTVGDAIGDLEGAGPSEYAIARGAGSVPIADHDAWRHRPETVEAMSSVPEGGRRQPSGRYFSQAYARLHRRGLARTVTTNFHNPGSGRFWHYCRDRSITVREAARLQGFQDDFAFSGTKSEQERQIGNAFPVVWAEAIGRHVWREVGSLL